MSEETRTLWQRLFGIDEAEAEKVDPASFEDASEGAVRELDIPPHDQLLAYFLSNPNPVNIEELEMDSPTLDSLREEGCRVVVPLVSQGELLGLMNLGSRRSEQQYSSEDLRLLNNLATQAAPALRVAQLAREQLAEAKRRERIEHELQVARVIQETLLPDEPPEIDGWSVAVHWQPARAVGGDFYDFVWLPDGLLGILIADVTDKGVPAAMVMATTRSLLRATAEKVVQPGEVLAQTNQLLHPDIPSNMFVTCLYLVLNPATGRVRFANAGHNLPYLRGSDGVQELRATGMPLGLMEDMKYEEREFTIERGESVMLSSDGLAEAHNPVGDMFGFPRVERVVRESPGGETLIQSLLFELRAFTGEGYEQEDDITLLTLERVELGEGAEQAGWGPRNLANFNVASEPGNERRAIEKVLEAVRPMGLSEAKVKRLGTAVGEATMNAMEHGNNYQSDLPVEIMVTGTVKTISVRITDQGMDESIPESTDPDLEAKLSGEQSPRGWGLYLIENMVDDLNVSLQDGKRSVELIMEME